MARGGPCSCKLKRLTRRGCRGLGAAGGPALTPSVVSRHGHGDSRSTGSFRGDELNPVAGRGRRQLNPVAGRGAKFVTQIQRPLFARPRCPPRPQSGAGELSVNAYHSKSAKDSKITNQALQPSMRCQARRHRARRHNYAFGNTEEKARYDNLGCKPRGRRCDGYFNHKTGKGCGSRVTAATTMTRCA